MTSLRPQRGCVGVLGAGLISGEGCLINRSCSLAHHVSLGGYVCTGPGAVLVGACRLSQLNRRQAN